MTEAQRVDRHLAVAAARALPSTVDNELRTRMRSLPVMIHTSGLAATAAFLLSRAKQENDRDSYWKTAVLILEDAATEAGISFERGRPKDTLRKVAEVSDGRYLLAEARAQLLAGWLSRLAQALADPTTRQDGTPS